MPSTVEQLGPSRVKLTIEVPFADLKPGMDKAYTEIAQSVTVPGFRKGKVPPRIIDQRFGRGTVIAEAFNSSVEQFYGQAITDNKITPLAQPDIQITKLEDGEAVEFTAEVDIRPDFELPDFGGIAVTVDAVEVTDEQVDEQVDLLRQRLGSMNVVDRPAADDDVVLIDLVATQNGVQLDDATAQQLSYRIGSGGMLDGLDEAVTGLSAGESNTFTSTLVGGSHAGDEAQIEVTVTKVQERILPELDDEFAQKVSEFSSVDELIANIREQLTAMARVDQANSARDKVLEEVIARVDFEIPERVLKTETDARREQITRQLAQAQTSLEDYLAEVEDGKSVEDFWADVDKRSADALKAQIVLDKIAEETDVQVDQNDLTMHILQIAQQSRQSPDEVAKHMVEHNHTLEYVTEIRRSKALANLVAQATVTDSNGAPVELANLRPDGTYATAEGDDDAPIQAEDAPVQSEDSNEDDEQD